MTLIGFAFFLLIFVVVGLSAIRKSRGHRQDYYVASRSMSAWLVGLSAVATNNSGYMFIGVIGYTYATGLASVWLMVGWILGDFLASLLIHRRIREHAEVSGEVSYLGLLSHWGGVRYKIFQRIAAVISMVLLLAYAGAQLVAGGKALHVLFDWPLWSGAVLGSILVAAYCFAGGIRASIWTDAVQSVVMITAMAALLLVATANAGGVEAAVEQMDRVQGFMDWFPKDLVLPGIMGGVLFALSWMFAGLSVAGQPHIMIRFMTLKHPQQMNWVRVWYYSWFGLFYAMTTAVGMLCRIYLPDAGSFDQELALPIMAQKLFPPVLVGLVLAGIFAATLSTADSLILSCSSAFTHDLLPHRIENLKLLKLTTICMTILALFWALTNSQSVFALVILAWSGMASAYVPLLLVWVMGRKPSQGLAIGMMISGLLAALFWRWLGWQDAVYEGMPGILCGLSIYVIGTFWTKFNPIQVETPELD